MVGVDRQLPLSYQRVAAGSQSNNLFRWHFSLSAVSADGKALARLEIDDHLNGRRVRTDTTVDIDQIEAILRAADLRVVSSLGTSPQTASDQEGFLSIVTLTIGQTVHPSYYGRLLDAGSFGEFEREAGRVTGLGPAGL
jgi:hypothetical protein